MWLVSRDDSGRRCNKESKRRGSATVGAARIYSQISSSRRYTLDPLNNTCCLKTLYCGYSFSGSYTTLTTTNCLLSSQLVRRKMTRRTFVPAICFWIFWLLLVRRDNNDITPTFARRTTARGDASGRTMDKIMRSDAFLIRRMIFLLSSCSKFKRIPPHPPLLTLSCTTVRGGLKNRAAAVSLGVRGETV